MLNNGKNAPKIDEVTDEQWATINKYNREITKEFLQESVNLSPKTLTQYKSCLRQFFWWVKVNCDDKSIIDIGRGMAGKVRKLQFDERAMEALKKWLEIRGEDNCPYMFVTKYKGEIKQVSDSTFQNWCSREFTEIVGRRVHPHLLRESMATNMVVGEGKDIKAAQKLLGHKSSETTEIYVIREDDDDLDEAFI